MEKIATPIKKILIIEDEKCILQIVRDALEDAEFVVMSSPNGELGAELALKENIDLVILDIMLPGIDGFEVVKRIKKKKPSLPIIILTAKSTEEDKLLGFELGADDYITKPFSVKELIMRVNVCLRRVIAHYSAKKTAPNKYEFGDIKLDMIKMESFKKNKRLEFTKKEYDILSYMINRKGEVVSRNDLLDVIWGYESIPETRTVDTFIARIRKKIEDKTTSPKYIKSVRSIGYKLDI
ncbi:two-component response phosphate regulator [Candidatus Omnitrophus magneticus]|uniref:Two-component response phosphate regulator n=1 Tax=Candidatus Omnitrophus magneticus TaxID=1609969 RepID=A0A0F0CR34_9BACT|nr:two-component response phosphate regulator [Candidatus Omnitrophus magneticus]